MNSVHPEWLTVTAPAGETMEEVKQLLDHGGLHAVCESADCPNVAECFARRTCTFMILGNVCTRNCGFCAVEHGYPDDINPREPAEIAHAVRELNLKHVVITTVTRDDLQDGGARQFVAVIRAIREASPRAIIEVLISDLKGRLIPLLDIVKAKPEIINHNMETVPRLYKAVRPQACYGRSLEILQWAKQAGGRIITKSGMMLGLGETTEEVLGVMCDLRQVGCNVLTLGQYLSPSRNHVPVDRFVHPDEFKELERAGLEMGFMAVSAGPLVRSSYNADDVYSRISQCR